MTEAKPAIQSLLAQVPLFSGLAPGELHGLTTLIRRHRYEEGEVIFHEGDAGTALYIIEKGEVKIVLGSAEGKEVVLSLLGPGDFFGELALLDGEPRSADAVAMETSDLLILQRHDFLRFVAEQPQVAVNLLAVLSRRLRRVDQLVLDAAFLDVRARLVRTLLELAQTRGQPGPPGPQSVVIASRLTQSDLANMIGATRESVNKWLRYYAQKGLVRHLRGRLTLLDVIRLREELY
jgi:CRP/FNR family transcriptional regulator, cyclic AMP receptor protein